MGQPEMWPVLDAFAAFVCAWIDIPFGENYSYHGFKRRCRKYKRPGPFRKVPCKPEGEDWILIFDGPIDCEWGHYFEFDYGDLLPSSDPYLCDPNEETNRYYFAEIEYIRLDDWPFAWMSFVDGLNCKNTTISHDGKYIYRAWFNLIMPKEMHDRLWWVISAKVGSWARTWKSKTGEFPGYYPVVQGHKEY